MPKPPDDPVCSDLERLGGTLTLICKGCRHRAGFTGLQAVLKFGEGANADTIRRRLNCKSCNKHGRTDWLWFSANFGFPAECYFTPEQLADHQAAADFDAQQRSQFSAGRPAAPVSRTGRKRR
ncbi:hypothetical protein GVN21_16675 [Caulobacter sp. SLTY]|uniref:hypothetical protein n=1 Tax=Caulobacter sp. SLTY TaxID=2683262 RepID=UPI00141299E7|nr:hypothetical protein [Caulobacter sp. SLTY]NBB17002.1 hypothetical protein [Caulobacter sp. SLTY]